MLLETAQAQGAFESLPASAQLPTLSPVYCAADAKRSAMTEVCHLQFGSAGAAILLSVQERSAPGGGSDWQSPYGYGGPVAGGSDASEMRSAWESFAQEARLRGVIAEFVRFHPLAGNEREYPGVVKDDRQTVTIDLTVTDLLASYSGRARNAISKARRAGLVLRWEEAAEFAPDFSKFYRDSMRTIGAAKFYLFSDEYFEALLSVSYARVLSVRRGEELLAVGVFLFGPEVVEYHLSGTSGEGRALGATNLLIHEAAEQGRRDNCTRLYLGGGTDRRPDNPLLRFKESFAKASALYRFGYRIFDTQAYERLRSLYPGQSASSGRVIFYRED